MEEVKDTGNKMTESQKNTEAKTEEASKENVKDQSETREEGEKLKKKLKSSEGSVKDYQRFLIRLGVLLLALWLLFFVFIGVTHMPNGDMYPRIDSGDMVLYYRLDKSVQSRDVIVFKKQAPGSDKAQLFVSRVVAVAGDTVEITEEGHLIVNGNDVVEQGIFYSTPRYNEYTQYPLKLQEGECFVLSDYRVNGSDSRFFGPVRADEIKGTVIMILRRNAI